MVANFIWKDIENVQEVDQFGYVDLVEAFANNAIPSTLSDTEAEYNDIEDPSTIMGKPSDVFEAMRFNQYIHDNGIVREETE